MRQIVDKYIGKFNETETSNKPGVLATIHGPVTGWKPNRNGRTYSRELWVKALDSDYVKEQVALKHFVGEADHPEDRLEPIIKEMSHSITDFEFRNDLQEVWATIDILDTPNGRSLKTLLDYSGALSFSTRGSGDVLDNGEVDPDTYQLFAIDAVLRPSYPTATVRLSESENLEKITDKQATSILEKYSGNRICESVDDLFYKMNNSLNEAVDAYGEEYPDELGDLGEVDPRDGYEYCSYCGEEYPLPEMTEVGGEPICFKCLEEMPWLQDQEDQYESDHSYKSTTKTSESFVEVDKHLLTENGNPKLVDRIEASLMIWFEENTEDMMDRTIDCKVNEEGYSYVITVKSPLLGRYNLFDEYDVMEYADDAGRYIADALHIEYIGSKKVNDRTFKIYLDNYYND